MAEVLVEFESEFTAPDGKLYDARACARRRDDGLWEGWLEFVPRTGGETVQTGRETTQPNRDDALYWATGLTTSYIDGALHRTLTRSPTPPHRVPSTQPAFDRPADRPVLDPYQVYSEGDHVLRGQLNALADGQLRTIIRAYDIADSGTSDAVNRAELIALIMAATARRAA